MCGEQRVHITQGSTARSTESSYRQRPTLMKRARNSCRYFIKRWRLLVFALPIAAISIVVRAALWSWFSGPKFVLDAGTVQLIVIASIILSVFMLHNAVLDFRVSFLDYARLSIGSCRR